MTAALPPLDVWPLAFFSLVPWLAAAWRARLIRGASSGFLLGAVHGAMTLLWLPPSLIAMGTPPAGAWGLVLLLCVTLGGPPYALVGLFVSKSGTRGAGFRIAVAAIALGAVDWLRTEARGVLPWLLLGHTQAPDPALSQWAVLGGAPLVSGILMAVNAALALWLLAGGARPNRAALWGAATIGAVAMAAPLPALEDAIADTATDDPATLRILAIQPNLLLSERWVDSVQGTHLRKLELQTRRAWRKAGGEVDLIVWPETVLTSPIERRPDLVRGIRALVDELDTPLVAGLVREAASGRPDRYRNSAVWIAPGLGVVDAVDKTLGVPLIEAPIPDGFAGRVLRSVLGRSSGGKRIESGSRAADLRGGFSVVPLLCYEAMAGRIASARRTSDSVLLLHLSNESWAYGDTVSQQQLASARFRAIEQGLPFLRVAHGGISAFVDRRGRLIESVPFGVEAAFVAEISLQRSGAPRGVSLVMLAALGAICGGFLGRRFEQRHAC